MKIQISKWGNSLALRIPKEVAAKLHLAEGVTAELFLEDSKMVIVKDKKLSLKLLVDQIQDNNIHPEYSTNLSIGNENIEW